MLIVAFVAVTTPLFFSSYYAATSLDKLSRNSAKVVFDVVHITRVDQLLREQINNIERIIRQYKLFKDDKMREILVRRIGDLRESIDSLRSSLGPNLRTQLSELENEIMALEVVFSRYQFADIGKFPEVTVRREPEKISVEQIDIAINRFEYIFQMATTIAAGVRKSVDATANDLRNRSRESQSNLLLGTVLIIPLTIILITFFISLIGRSFRQLGSAITGLGDFALRDRIKIVGPKDIRELGIKLNWLRLRFREIESEKKKFLRHMSHELKTPVANFQEGTALLADEIPGPLNERQKEVVDILQRNVSQFKHHIGNLLDFNVPKFKQGSQIGPFDFGQLVHQAISSHKLSSEHKRLKVIAEGQAVEVMGDRQKFMTVIDNLISNAVNFSRTKGTVSVDWKVSGDIIDFRVTDNGPGLDSEEFERIFAPFYQGTAKRSGPLKGSGVGLSVARECMKSIGGNIFARNNDLQGACFLANFPIKA